MKHLKIFIQASLLCLLTLAFSSCQKTSIQAIALIANQQCPIEVEEGLVVTNIMYQNNSLCYICRVDEDYYDIDELSQSQSTTHDSLVDYLISENESDDEVSALLNVCKSSGVNIVYRYVGATTGKSFDVTITIDELDI